MPSSNIEELPYTHASNFVFLKIGGTQAIGQSSKKAPRPSSGKEYTEGWHWSKGIIPKLKKGQAMASVAVGKFEPCLHLFTWWQT